MKAVGLNIIVAPIAKDVIKEGIYLPIASDEETEIGEVKSVGRLVEGIYAGDKVIYDAFAGESIVVNGEKVKIIREGDVLAVTD